MHKICNTNNLKDPGRFIQTTCGPVHFCVSVSEDSGLPGTMLTVESLRLFLHSSTSTHL